MKKRRNDILKTAGILLLLFALTFFILEFPKHYYAREEEKLPKKITVEEYAAKFIGESVPYEEKLEALENGRLLISGKGKLEKGIKEMGTAEELQMTEEILTEVFLLLPEQWAAQIQERILYPETEREWKSVRLIWIQEKEIQSFEIGILRFGVTSEDWGEVWFGADDHKIILFNVYSNSQIFPLSEEEAEGERDRPFSEESMVEEFRECTERYFGRHKTFSRAEPYMIIALPFPEETGEVPGISAIVEYTMEGWDERQEE